MVVGVSDVHARILFVPRVQIVVVSNVACQVTFLAVHILLSVFAANVVCQSGCHKKARKQHDSFQIDSTAVAVFFLSPSTMVVTVDLERVAFDSGEVSTGFRSVRLPCVVFHVFLFSCWHDCKGFSFLKRGFLFLSARSTLQVFRSAIVPSAHKRRIRSHANSRHKSWNPKIRQQIHCGLFHHRKEQNLHRLRERHEPSWLDVFVVKLTKAAVKVELHTQQQ